MSDKQASAVEDDEAALDSAFLERSSSTNVMKKLNRSDTLKKWYREPAHRQVMFTSFLLDQHLLGREKIHLH